MNDDDDDITVAVQPLNQYFGRMRRSLFFTHLVTRRQQYSMISRE